MQLYVTYLLGIGLLGKVGYESILEFEETTWDWS